VRAQPTPSPVITTADAARLRVCDRARTEIGRSQVSRLPRTSAALDEHGDPMGTALAEAAWNIEPQPGRGSLVELRQWAAAWMHDHAVEGVDTGDVLLVLTELVTNSIQHTAGPVRVALGWDGLRLRAGVTDCSPELPRWPPTHLDPEGGRGLVILDRLSTTWGLTEHRPDSKTVWCEFARDGITPSGR
jgi:hypothetical protein